MEKCSRIVLLILIKINKQQLFYFIFINAYDTLFVTELSYNVYYLTTNALYMMRVLMIIFAVRLPQSVCRYRLLPKASKHQTLEAVSVLPFHFNWLMSTGCVSVLECFRATFSQLINKRGVGNQRRWKWSVFFCILHPLSPACNNTSVSDEELGGHWILMPLQTWNTVSWAVFCEEGLHSLSCTFTKAQNTESKACLRFTTSSTGFCLVLFFFMAGVPTNFLFVEH